MQFHAYLSSVCRRSHLRYGFCASLISSCHIHIKHFNILWNLIRGVYQVSSAYTKTIGWVYAHTCPPICSNKIQMFIHECVKICCVYAVYGTANSVDAPCETDRQWLILCCGENYYNYYYQVAHTGSVSYTHTHTQSIQVNAFSISIPSIHSTIANRFVCCECVCVYVYVPVNSIFVSIFPLIFFICNFSSFDWVVVFA